jgi:hypothetical protein
VKRSLCALLVVACNHSSSNKPDGKIALIDAAPDAQKPDAPSVGANPILIEVPDAAVALIAYRDGNGPWMTPATSASGYTLHVTDAYEVVVVCHDSTGFDAEMLAATADDGDRQLIGCIKNIATPASVHVTGHMVQAGAVFLYDSATSTTSQWNYDIEVPTGTQDLIAIGTNNRMLIRRNLSITAATMEPPIDVVADGTAMTPVALTISGLGSDALTTLFELTTPNGGAFFYGTSTTVQTPSASLIQGGDAQYIQVSAANGTGRRRVFAPFTGLTTFTLPPPLTGVTFSTSGGVLTGAWTSLPSHRYVRLDIDQVTMSQDSAQHVKLTKRWIAATSATSIAFDPLPPGYDPAWRVDLSVPYTRTLTVNDSSPPGTVGVSIVESVNGALLRSARRSKPQDRSEHVLGLGVDLGIDE